MVTFAAVSTNLSDDQSQLNQRTRQLLANFVKEVARDEANEKMSVVQKTLDKAVKAAGAATAAAASLDNDNIKLQGKIDSKKKDIEKLNEKIAKMQKDIADYEAEIEKNNGKKAEYTQKAADAGKQVEALNAEIEGYKSAIQ